MNNGKKCFLFWILSILASLLSACGGRKTYTMAGDYLVYDTAKALVDASDVIFSGKVMNIRYEMLDVRTEPGVDSMTASEETERLPYTLYEIEIMETYKGEYESNRIVLKRPGGIFDDATYKVADATEILQNEQYLFLAEEFSDSYPSLLNPTQASYHLNEAGISSNEEAITLNQILELLEE